jgi:hypothetical protein
VPDVNEIAGVDHYIPIKVIRISDADSNSIMFAVFRPNPAAPGKSIFSANLDLSGAPDPNCFQAAVRADSHPDSAIARKPEPAEQSFVLTCQ